VTTAQPDAMSPDVKLVVLLFPEDERWPPDSGKDDSLSNAERGRNFFCGVTAKEQILGGILGEWHQGPGRHSSRKSST